ncbi:MAG: hypothetical protein GX116_09055 [Fibrobacter sp.]|jgi:single-stranded DNA-binding protein|nr:hypothetical protein [Fibrobacter sp.]
MRFFKSVLISIFFIYSFGVAANKTIHEYYREAAFQYIENRLPTAEITCQEGLSRYPNSLKLQMLLDRILEAKNEQKKQNQDPSQQNQDQNQDPSDSNENEQKDSPGEDQDSNENSDSPSDSKDSTPEENPEPKPEDADSNPENTETKQNEEDHKNMEPPQEELLDYISPEEASQLLKDFNEEKGERKPWRGKTRPLKDW